MSIGSTSLPYLRVRAVSRFPAVVQGTNGTKVVKENGVYTIGPSTGDLMEVASVTDGTFVQIWDEDADSYARIPSSAFVGGGGAVTSVNGKTGAVVLAPSDIAGFATVATTGDYNDLINKPAVGTGDMEASVYDPTGVEDDAFSMGNMAETTSAKVFSGTERTKLAGVASGATANSPDATLLARANHTGTQSADTLTDGTTNKAFLATERTKLAGIATGATANTGTVTSVAMTVPTGLSISGSAITTSGTLGLTWTSGYQGYTTTEASKLSGIASGATANDTDANLKNRANHTGTQAASTITGLATVATTGAYSNLSGLPTLGTIAALSYPGGTTTFLRADGTFATPPGGGGGGGDMYAAVYDPNGVADDAFDMDNMAEGTTAKIFTATERSKLSGIEAGADVTDATNVAAAGAFMKAADNSDAITAGTTNLFMTPTERSKLSGVATGATANTGTVTSVALAVPTGLSISGSPITTSGTLTVSYAAGYQGYTSTEATKLSGIATGATANTGTVTSVAASVPTGLSISGSPITTSGTLAFTWTAGYQGYTTTEASKLSGIASGATANSSDATLLNRANHTGSQAVGTITGLGSSATVNIASAAEFRALTASRMVSTDSISGGMAEVTLTDATTIAWDMSTGVDFVVTLGGNRTLGNPTNTTVGSRGRIRVVQGSPGNRTLALSSNLKTAGGAGITLSTASGAVDYLDYDVVSSTNIRIALSKAWA